MERYRNIIKGQLYGHNHEDSFQIMHGFKNSSEYVSYGIVNPSLGIFTSNNPAFRIFYIDKTTYDIVDFDTIRLYVDKANKNDDPRWELAYRFTTYYGYRDAALENVVDLAQRLIIDRDLTSKFVRMKTCESPNWKRNLDDPGTHKMT